MAKNLPSVTAMENSEISAAAAMMTKAFAHDPSYHYLVPNARKYNDRLNWMMHFMLRLCQKHGIVHRVDNPMQGIAAWLKPGDQFGFIDELRAGALTAPFSLGITSAWRSNAIMAGMRKNRQRLTQGAPYWYLWQFAVAPESRGKGYGRALLQPVLKEADATGTDCWLDNSNAANLPIYEALGFRTVEEYTIENKQQIVKLWHMCRKPEKTKKKDR